MEIVTAYENLGAGPVVFDGYGRATLESRIVGILRDGAAVGNATQGQQVEIVLAETCFYAEGGGQVGDRGVIKGPNGADAGGGYAKSGGRPDCPSRRRGRGRHCPGGQCNGAG